MSIQAYRYKPDGHKLTKCVVFQNLSTVLGTSRFCSLNLGLEFPRRIGRSVSLHYTEPHTSIFTVKYLSAFSKRLRDPTPSRPYRITQYLTLEVNIQHNYYAFRMQDKDIT